MKPIIVIGLLVTVSANCKDSPHKSAPKDVQREVVPLAPLPLPTHNWLADAPTGTEASASTLGWVPSPHGPTTYLSLPELGGVNIVELSKLPTESEAMLAVEQRLTVQRGVPDKPESAHVEILPDGIAITYQYNLYRARDGAKIGQDHGAVVYRRIGTKVAYCSGLGGLARISALQYQICKSLRAG